MRRLSFVFLILLTQCPRPPVVDPRVDKLEKIVADGKIDDAEAIRQMTRVLYGWSSEERVQISRVAGKIHLHVKPLYSLGIPTDYDSIKTWSFDVKTQMQLFMWRIALYGRKRNLTKITVSYVVSRIFQEAVVLKYETSVADLEKIPEFGTASPFTLDITEQKLLHPHTPDKTRHFTDEEKKAYEDLKKVNQAMKLLEDRTDELRVTRVPF